MKFVGSYWFLSGWNYFSWWHTGWRREFVRTNCYLSEELCVEVLLHVQLIQSWGLWHLWMVPNQTEEKHWAKLALLSLAKGEFWASIWHFLCLSKGLWGGQAPPDPQEDWADLNSPFRQLGTWLKQNEFHLKACKILNWVEESIHLCWWQNKGLAMKLQVKAATGRFRRGVTTPRIWLSPWHRHLALFNPSSSGESRAHECSHVSPFCWQNWDASGLRDQPTCP